MPCKAVIHLPASPETAGAGSRGSRPRTSSLLLRSGVDSVTPTPNSCPLVQPQSITSYGNRVLVDLINYLRNLKGNHPGFRVGGQCNGRCPYKTLRRAQRDKEKIHVTVMQRLEGCGHEPRAASSHEKR